ncbi:ABC transporter ATP-binding protein [Variovorax sp. PCZ-1]|uniref:ABC transporter ATP-binding protein n=1 Tax=Variovorax sp. PCZ-1 TaxID=2835533 RepID=UPI001BCA835A|nr:ABC transporter ATP-binding protein [Variovorax sp. PCZ-1]MBS7807006.1 ABC transporter ATP-binding protein [Variovorax sp. PCZ-1]
MKNIALRADSLRASIEKTLILPGISVQFTAGCWTSVVGPNGAGKSTLLKALCGLLPSEGKIELLGQVLAQWDARERARQLAWLGQDSASVDELSVADVVMLGRLPHQSWLSVPSEEDMSAVQWAMRSCEVHEWHARRVGELSAGERQRVLLARALAVRARVLVMDEPLTNLDVPHQAQWVQVMRGLVKQGITVISVLHELQVALMADEMLIMAHGHAQHLGACDSPATHEALRQAFDLRLQVRMLDGQAMVLMDIRKETHAN